MPIPEQVRRSIEAVWRIESARLIGGLVRVVRDLASAEDLAHEALLAALETWPGAGIPGNPGAWLMATARHRGLDELRKQKRRQRKHGELERGSEIAHLPDLDAALDEDVGDDVLRLMLAASHPVLPPEARVALTLRLLGGLTCAEIARAFLVPEPTIAQRLVRAKRTLAEAKVPFEVPRGEELSERVTPVLSVIYLVFNEGYAPSSGAWVKPALCDDALRLGRVLCARVPLHAEAHGLLALMELQSSRSRARLGPEGEPILLADQDRSRWEPLAIARGLAALARAESLAQPLGPYALQAAIAACHSRAQTFAATDWERIVALYDALAALTQNPVVELNRAVAVSRAYGAQAGLDLVDELADEPSLRGYHLLPSVRGDLLQLLGRKAEARAELERAAQLTQNKLEQALLVARAASLA